MAQPRTVLWQDMTDSEIAGARDAAAIVAVPVGAIEQHGPHLPVNTDIVLSAAVTKAAAELTSIPVLVAPELAIGFSPHHLSKPGTLSLRLRTFQAIIEETAAAIIASGFPRIVFVNGHGGNAAPLRAAVGELVTDGLPVAAIDYFAPSEATWSPMLSGALDRLGHACEFETALFLHVRSHDDEAVARTMRAKKNLPPRILQPWLIPGDADDPIAAAGAAWPPIFQADDSGYFGDPAAATLDLGERLFAVLGSGLAEFFTTFAATPLRMGISRDPAKRSISPAVRNDS